MEKSPEMKTVIEANSELAKRDFSSRHFLSEQTAIGKIRTNKAARSVIICACSHFETAGGYVSMCRATEQEYIADSVLDQLFRAWIRSTGHQNIVSL